LLKEVRNHLMSLKKSLDQSLGKIRVAVIVEGGRKTQIADTTSTTLCILSVGALLAFRDETYRYDECTPQCHRTEEKACHS